MGGAAIALVASALAVEVGTEFWVLAMGVQASWPTVEKRLDYIPNQLKEMLKWLKHIAIKKTKSTVIGWINSLEKRLLNSLKSMVKDTESALEDTNNGSTVRYRLSRVQLQAVSIIWYKSDYEEYFKYSSC